MKDESNNKKESPTLDMNQLREDYREGHSAMGKQDRGYYITNWRGMQSLQSYCTSEIVHHYGGGAYDEKLREVQVKNNGKEYAMKSWTYDKFENHLAAGLRDINVPFKRQLFGGNSADIYEAVIENVFDGELDRTAFLDAATSKASPSMRYDVELSMKLDILKAKDGRTDKFAKAGAFAYEKGLAPHARLVDFTGNDQDDFKDELTGSRYIESDHDEWMRQAERMYLDVLIDKSNGTDTIELGSAKDVMGTIQAATNKTMRSREGEWDKLVDYLQKDVVFFLDDNEDSINGQGMKHQADVHNAVGLSQENDWANSYGKYEPRYIRPKEELEQDLDLDF